ncbi:SulP family inorganic anion transporter [Halocola ammonii]
MKKYLKYTPNDLLSGLVVFLVALPLCLGIALASGAPLFSGLVSGIVAGIVVGLLSGSQTSVSGPAAGLTVIVLNAITDLNSFEAFLVTVVLAGIIQLILGTLKAGIIGLYFPSSVIRGMLAAIGLILILKQIPHFLGFDQDAFGEMSFWGTDGRNTFEEVAYSLTHISPGALIIGAVGLLTLILWDKPFIQKIKGVNFVPGALVAVLLGLGMNELYKLFSSNLIVNSEHLVNVPNVQDPAQFAEIKNQTVIGKMLGGDWEFFSILNDPLIWQTAFVIALIASLETLLSVEAADKLDKQKRSTNKNREMRAQGVGNIIAGFFGGLPMTAVIVRSSTNIESGAKSKMSAFYHGIFLLVCVAAIPFALNMIPYASLAAVLLVVGYKLSKPQLYIKMYKDGMDQFIPFMVTIIAILLTDLLYGIVIGLAVGIFYILKANYKFSHFYREEEVPEEDHKKVTIKLSEHVSFLNKAGLQKRLYEVPKGTHLVVDGSRSRFIDHDAREMIYEFQTSCEDRGMKCDLINIDARRGQLDKDKKVLADD